MFVPPAEPHLVGLFVTVVSYEPLVSHFVRAHAWRVRLNGDPVPCAISGLPIFEGITFDDCLWPIRPRKVPAFDRLVLPAELERG